MSNVRQLLIVITPLPPSDLKTIFSGEANSIRRLLEQPPELRPHGWGIGTGGTVRSVNGESIQTESFRETVTLYRDGQLIVASRIDRDSLAWADNTDSRIHPLALVEFVTSALIFYRFVIADMKITPEILRIEIQLHNLAMNNGTTLPAGAVNNMGWTHGKKSAPAASLAREITVEVASYNAELTAFRLLREVYVWFGHTDDAIPYVKGVGEDRRIDTSAIVAIG